MVELELVVLSSMSFGDEYDVVVRREGWNAVRGADGVQAILECLGRGLVCSERCVTWTSRS